jgi:membrane protease YdiL (CAAX protease family)
VALFVLAALFLRPVLGAVALRLFADADELTALQRAAAEGGRIDLGLILAAQAATLPLVVLAIVWWVRRIDRRPALAIGARAPRARWLVAALGLAAGLLAVWLVTVSQVVDFARTPQAISPLTLLLFAGGFLAAAAIEEWIYRGYVYSALRERLGWVHAAAVSALLFGLLPNLFFAADLGIAELLSVLLIGLLLAELRELSGEVWTPALFHGGWNFLLGCVVSLPVSGLDPPSLYAVTVRGPESWSGGPRGPEASWPLTVLVLAAVAALAVWIERRRGGERSAG